MPFGWDDSQDSDYTYEYQISFAGGQHSNAQPRMLKEDETILLQDCDVSLEGAISNRFGTVRVGSNDVGSGSAIDALLYYFGTTDNYDMAFSNGTVYKANGGTWSSTHVLTGYSDLPSLIQGNTKAFVAAGTDIKQFDGTTWVNLSSDSTTTAPRDASILLWHNNRLVAAGKEIRSVSTDPVAVPDAIYFSDILDAATWGTNKNATQIRVGAGDGLEITSIVKWSGFNLAVFKRHSVWVVNADPQLDIADFPIQLIHGTVGCVARRSAVQVGADIIFLSDDGVRSLQTVIGSSQQGQLAPPISYPIQDVIKRINWAYAANAAAFFWRGLYLLAVPLDLSTTNNYILVYNTLTGTWNGYWTGLPVNCFNIREGNGISRLMMGLNSDDKVIEYLDYINPSGYQVSTFQDYQGNNVVPVLKTKGFIFGDIMSPKLGIGGELEWNNSEGSITLTPIIDDQEQETITISLPSRGRTIPVTLPCLLPAIGVARQSFDLMKYGEFRTLQFKITGSDQGRKELQEFNAAAIVRPSTVGHSNTSDGSSNDGTSAL